jgi:DNA-directed RNA polymerase subunit RPC12/RpoP
MKIICLECHREIGEKFPFDDPRETHTICPECIEKRLTESSKGGLRRKVNRKSRRGG